MSRISAHQVVNDALQANALEALLLERPPYTYLPHGSPATGASDLTVLLDSLYDGTFSLSKDEIKDRLFKTLSHLVNTYEGLPAVAACILFESHRVSRNAPALGLPVADLAKELKASIDRFRSRLVADRNGEGAHWRDGLLGELRRLSNNAHDIGGPAFVGGGLP